MSAVPWQLRKRIVALAAAGYPPIAIADELPQPVDITDIRQIVCAARSKGGGIPRFRAANGSAGMRRTVNFSRAALQGLQPHARTRNISVNELVRRLIEAVIEGEIVDAVLDDGIKA